MINRKDRDSITYTIQLYLDEKIDTFEFDELLQDIRADSKDETVLYVIDTLWYYDDLKDHKILFTKGQWDYVQRLLLILSSDKEIFVKEERKFTIRQILSIVLVAIFVLAYFYLGFTFELLLVSMGLGVPSMIMSEWRTNAEYREDANHIKEELYPFSNLLELSSFRRDQKLFKKSYYNKVLEKREIRDKYVNGIMHIYYRLSWLVWSPLVLLYQSFPEVNTKISVG